MTNRNNLTSNPAILNEAREYLDGLMLSDGHIPPVKYGGTGLYRQSCEHKSWLDKINEDLYEYGIECRVDDGRLITGGFSPEGGSIAYSLRTRYYVEFKEMHDKWYIKWYDIDNYNKHFWRKDKDGEYFIWQKIVPRDICLSPVCLANEYFGDGWTSKQTHHNGYHTVLATNGYLREDTLFLADLLSETLNIKCGVNKAGAIGIYTQTDISTFLNYIKDYRVDCYSKKFPEEAMK